MSKVMLIEDDRTMLSLLGTLLQIEGFQVVMAADQKMNEIFTQLSQEQPDIALLDVNLRQGSGLDLLQHIRQDETLNHVRILMSSGIDYRDQCLEKGADSFILKPYMPEDLINLIYTTLKKNNL
jgi:DNA-binding response OmpR family regulator